MNLNLFVLGKNEKENIDNSKCDAAMFFEKLLEEVEEVKVEVYRLNKMDQGNIKLIQQQRNRLIGEILDVIQVCILGLKVLITNKVQLKQRVFFHNYKLINERKWNTTHKIKIEIEEDTGGKYD